MFGKNPKRPPAVGDGSYLDVQEIFPTIQGEGPNTGMASVFVRLGGCNLACNFCDTEFESFSKIDTDEIVARVIESSKDNGKRARDLVVITGGEPFRQPIELLCSKLIEAGFKVQIETNGTLFRNIPNEVEIICSPKSVGSYGNVREDILERTRALKFIISASDKNYSFVPDVGQSKFGTEVFLQPMDEYDLEKNAANLELTQKLCNQGNYKLSRQMHKIWGIK